MIKSRKTAILIGYGTVFANAISSIVLTNLYIKHLGYDDYGLYQMINAITQYILLFDFGITTTVSRFRVACLEKGSKKEDENLLAHSFSIVAFLIAAVVAAGLIIRGNINYIYPSLTETDIEISQKMILFIIFQIVATLIQHLFAGIAMSDEHYGIVKVSEFLRVISKLLLIAALIGFTKNVMTVVYIDFLSTALAMLIIVIYVLKNIKFSIRFHHFDRVLLGALLVLMFSLLLQSIAAYINNAAGKTILGNMMEKSAVTVYSFAVTIHSFFAAIPHAMNSVFVPQATQLVINGANGEKLTDLVIKVGRIQFMFCGATIAGFILFGKYFLEIWVGKDGIAAWPCAIIILLAHMLPLVQNVCLSILVAKNKRLIPSLVVIFTSAINIAITIFCVGKLGIIGAAIGTGFSFVLGDLVLNNIYYHKVIGLNVFRMFKEIFNRTLLCILAASFVSAFTLFIPCGAFLHLAVGAFVFVLVYAAVLWLWGANKYEKQIILNVPIFKRFKSNK